MTMTTTVGSNVTMDVQNGTLVITCQLDGNFGPSSSGKTVIVASTGGNVGIPGTDAQIGFNLYHKVNSKPKLSAGTRAESTYGDNVLAKVKGNTLSVVVKLDADFGLSQSGKTRIIASTRGNASIPGGSGISMGVNVYRKVKA